MTSTTDPFALPARGRRSRARTALREAGPLEVSTMLSEAPTAAGEPAPAEPPALPLCIPSGPGFLSGTAGESVPVSHGGRTYRVRTGDDLASVAARFGVSVPALVELNGLGRRPRLQPGQIVSLPERQAAQGAATVRVRPGDTLDSVAAAQHVSPAELRRANAMGESSLIVEGELLDLAGSGAMSHRPPLRIEDLGELPFVAGGTAEHPPETLLAARVNKRTLHTREIPSRRAARRMIEAVAGEHSVDPQLASAVAQLESGWHHGVVSPGNAIGIMQVTPHAAWTASVRIARRLDVLDARDNVTAGVVILSALLDAARDEKEALAAYHQGLRSLRAGGVYPDAGRFAANALIIAERLRAEVRR
ncbi:LysM peptidoglycan-binding domain-containing protein [Brevibacterium album]|uniref:LysM peptidoglycan-binding domain-containing protein n=1 Tax=Brevibacterium album TaxID=417948 RepID=UPI00040CFDF6|nr:LysM peptidoglycan-binding domain-containing protein [Brevibacterium album]